MTKTVEASGLGMTKTMISRSVVIRAGLKPMKAW